MGNDSRLELSVDPLALANDLAFLPRPFFDRRDSRPLTLPIVFAGAPDAAQLEAAGTISSWFGALAGFRGASFPAAVGQIPAKAMPWCWALGAQGVAGLNLPPAAAPSVTMARQPSERPRRQLLIIRGRDAQGSSAPPRRWPWARQLSGPTAHDLGVQTNRGAQALRRAQLAGQDRPVKFGELAQRDAQRVRAMRRTSSA